MSVVIRIYEVFFVCENKFRGEEKRAGIYFHMKTGTVLQTKFHEVVHINRPV